MYAGLAIYDTMQFIKPDVQTICVGIATSMGALLLAGGADGKRMSLPNSKILIHQVSSAFQGQATDIEIHAKEIIDVRRRLDEILAKHTKQDLEKVAKDTERDYFMSADEAAEYNLIDRVISKHRSRLDDPSRRGIGWPAAYLEVRYPRAEGEENSGSAYGLERTTPLQLLRKVATPGEEVDRRAGRLHLRRVHRSL